MPQDTPSRHTLASPPRVRNSKKSRTLATFPGRERKRQRIMAELQALLNNDPVPPPPSIDSAHAEAAAIHDDAFEEVPFDPDPDAAFDIQPEDEPQATTGTTGTKSQRSGAQAKINHFARWTTMIPSLVTPYLSYLKQTLGKTVRPPPDAISHCDAACELKKHVLVALFYDCKFFLFIRCSSHQQTSPQMDSTSQDCPGPTALQVPPARSLTGYAWTAHP
jgi:hypothetical protein